MAYIVVEDSAIEELRVALEALAQAQEALSEAAGQLGDLGQDLCDDAVLRLRERHASEPQITSYREGWELRRRTLIERVRGLREVSRTLEASVARVRGFGGAGSDELN